MDHKNHKKDYRSTRDGDEHHDNFSYNYSDQEHDHVKHSGDHSHHDDWH